MMGELILIVIQKTANVELASPIQHFQFSLIEILQGK
jgi:hypothetical protein